MGTVVASAATVASAVGTSAAVTSAAACGWECGWEPSPSALTQPEDARTLLTLALLPPPPCADPPAAIGAQLEVFLQHWLARGWSKRPLRATLRAHMRWASHALCWLIEHRPALVAQAALGPELLLDAIRVAACRVPVA